MQRESLSHMSTPKTGTLVLVRHAEATGQSPTATLTEAGMGAAERLADFLSDYPVDFIATSRMARARQTIEPYASRTGLPIHQDHRLNERILSTEPITNWREIVRRSFDDPDLHAPGGESGAQVLYRAQAALEDIFERGHAMPLVVTHGNLMALLLHAADATFGYPGWQALGNPDVYLLSRLADGSRRFQSVWRP